MSSEQARLIAERIARRVDSGAAPERSTDLSSELSAVRATLNELQGRLASIEAKVGGPTTRVHSPWLHPSEERFGVEEATVSQMVDYFQGEKACSMEPGKSCDHCAMCSSRGF